MVGSILTLDYNICLCLFDALINTTPKTIYKHSTYLECDFHSSIMNNKSVDISINGYGVLSFVNKGDEYQLLYNGTPTKPSVMAKINNAKFLENLSNYYNLNGTVTPIDKFKEFIDEIEKYGYNLKIRELSNNDELTLDQCLEYQVPISLGKNSLYLLALFYEDGFMILNDTKDLKEHRNEYVKSKEKIYSLMKIV